VSRLPYGRQLIEDDDIAEVVRVLKSDYLTTGPEVDAFEAELADACGAKHAVVVANGTAALHCAYAAAGIGAGDEVVTTPLTFSSTANMVLAQGARPRFVDVDRGTLCVDPARVADALNERTRVLAPVDFAGHPAPFDELMALAEERGLIVVEDASHSLGGKYRGRRIGSIAHMTTFSFHPVKTITTGEGGAILTDDDRLAERCRDFRNHGLVREPARLSRNDGPWFYEVQSLGLNYRLSSLQCALGRSQLRKLPRFVTRRSELVARYRTAFARLPRIRMMTQADGVEPAWHLFPVIVDGGAPARASFFASMQRRDIGVQVHYIAVNDLPLYRELGHRPEETPIAYEASSGLVSLPLFPAMSDADADRVIAAVHEALHELG
jgi:UDP-4-amino-4,6-dideoxy-N-acetyl-beta-L-altrosamine transaminase